MTKTEIADELDRIKQLVEKVDEAINKLAIAVEGDEKVEKAAPAPVITLEDVRAALTKLASAKGATHVKALLADYNAKKLSDLAPINYQAVLFAAEKEQGSE